MSKWYSKKDIVENILILISLSLSISNQGQDDWRKGGRGWLSRRKQVERRKKGGPGSSCTETGKHTHTAVNTESAVRGSANNLSWTRLEPVPRTTVWSAVVSDKEVEDCREGRGETTLNKQPENILKMQYPGSSFRQFHKLIWYLMSNQSKVCHSCCACTTIIPILSHLLFILVFQVLMRTKATLWVTPFFWNPE